MGLINISVCYAVSRYNLPVTVMIFALKFRDPQTYLLIIMREIDQCFLWEARTVVRDTF